MKGKADMAPRQRLVLFLGAGASKGIYKRMPVGKELLRAIHRNIPKVATSDDQRMIVSALKQLFPPPMGSRPRKVLGMDYELVMTLFERMKTNPSNEISALCGDPDRAWHVLLAALGRAVHVDVGAPKNYMRKKELSALIRILGSCDEQCDSFNIVTTNYDLLFDKAVQRVFDHNQGNGPENYDYDSAYHHLSRNQYGVAMFGEMKIVNGAAKLETAGYSKWKLKTDQIQLFKLHGSINWAYCPNCSDPELEENSGILGNFSREEVRTIFNTQIQTTRSQIGLVCPLCGRARIEWLIVPPVHLKDIRQAVLRRIWAQARNALAEANRIVFIGYSLPAADPGIRELLVTSRALSMARHGKPWTYTLIDCAPGPHVTFQDLFGSPEFQDGLENFKPTAFEKKWLPRIVS